MIIREEGNSMPRIRELIAMSALLTIAALISGCYTMVGYSPEIEEGIIEEEAAPGQVYRDYEYYYDRPYSYYWDYYDPYYGLWYPYSYYYYRGYPWWRYYDDYYYWGYGERYVPEEKPGPRRREASRPQRARGPSIRRGSRSEEENKQPSERRTSEETRRPVRRGTRDSSSGSKERSDKRKSQDEE